MLSKEVLEKCAAIITILGFPILIVSTLFAYKQISELRIVVSSQNNIALNTLVFSSDNVGIINAIQNSKPILTEHGGKFTDAQLDNYLGVFDTIQNAYEEHLLTENELCVSFSYYIIETPKNIEIKKYISEQRSSNQDFFISLTRDLQDAVVKSKNPNCRS